MKGQKRLCGCAYDWCISSERRLGTVPSTRSLQPAPTCGGKLETFMRIEVGSDRRTSHPLSHSRRSGNDEMAASAKDQPAGFDSVARSASTCFEFFSGSTSR